MSLTITDFILAKEGVRNFNKYIGDSSPIFSRWTDQEVSKTVALDCG